MNKPETQVVREEEIPEVTKLREAEEALEEFKKMYPGLMDELQELATSYNTALQAAEKAVRARKVKCGPFNLYQWQRKIDAKAFYDAMGKEDFLKLGGSIETVPQYSINETEFNAKVAQGKIPSDVLKVVITDSPRYKTPDPLKIP